MIIEKHKFNIARTAYRTSKNIVVFFLHDLVVILTALLKIFVGHYMKPYDLDQVINTTWLFETSSSRETQLRSSR